MPFIYVQIIKKMPSIFGVQDEHVYNVIKAVGNGAFEVQKYVSRKKRSLLVRFQ